MGFIKEKIFLIPEILAISCQFRFLKIYWFFDLDLSVDISKDLLKIRRIKL